MSSRAKAREWPLIRLRFCATINPSKSEVGQLPENMEVSFLPMEAIGEDGAVCLDGRRTLLSVLQGYTYFRDGDVLIAKITPCFENGKGACVSGLLNGVGFGTTELIVIRVAAEKLNNAFLHWLFTSPDFRTAATATMFGAGGQKRVPDDFVRDYRIALPSLPEQRAIAAFLNRETAKIDALVGEQERLLVLLEEKRQAVIANVVTKGLDPTVPMKDSGVEWLGQVPAHWSLRPVRWLSTFVTSGPRGWSDYIDIEGSLFIQSGDLTENATIEFSAAKRVKVKDDAETARTSLQEGDVVVCITGAKTGKVAVCTRMPETAYVNQHLCLIRPKQDVVPTFLGHVLKSRVGREHFQSTQYGLKQGLSLDNIKTAVIPLPPRAEQKHILGYLSAQERVYRSLTEEAQQLARLLGERRAALISATVTGKIDVRALIPATEPALAAE